MSRELFDEQGIYPTQDGGVVVLLGGVAEVLDLAEANMRLDYVIRRANNLASAFASDPTTEAAIASDIADRRMMAYRAALAHGAK
jgi:hypothetical protein